MSKMYENAKIVEIEMNGNEEILLFIETDCPFHLSQQIGIANDPTIFDQVDIPAYDGRNVAEWIAQVVEE